MSDENLECRLAAGAVLRTWDGLAGVHRFVVQERDVGVAEAGKVGLGAGFINTHKGETVTDGLLRELRMESDGILTPELVMDGLHYEPVYEDTVVGWAFKDKRTEGEISKMNKSHYFYMVDIDFEVAEALVKAGNRNAEVRNWFMVEADETAIVSLDWAEWRNILTPNEPGDFHQRQATLNALKREPLFEV